MNKKHDFIQIFDLLENRKLFYKVKWIHVILNFEFELIQKENII
jgi:hypothetical protein